MSDPVQAVNDAVDEVSSLLNKFHGAEKGLPSIPLLWLGNKYNNPAFRLPLECAPDLSDPMSAATYAAEEVSVAKDEFVRYFSDEEGMETCSVGVSE